MNLIAILITFCTVSYVYSVYTYTTHYIDVPLDHFSFSNNRTFSLRYLVNDSYWNKKNGPIFFYTGNEGDIEMFAQNTGFMWESAPYFEALLVFAEHRYYGKSMPFGNKSLTKPEYIGYLTSEQALADFVDVIYRLKGKGDQETENGQCRKNSNPVIAFGGSYGGMLAAWMRMKYPAVIEGSLASSAPIWQFKGMTSCNSFNDVVTSAYKRSAGDVCVKNIRKSWDSLNNLSKSDSGRKWINKNWKLCTPLNSSKDVDTLIDWLTNTYVDLAMINYPYPTNFLMPVPANPVKETCKPLNAQFQTDQNLLKAVFQAVTVYFNYTGGAKCLEWIRDPSSGLGTDGWNIQTCLEMVMPMCANGKTDMFLPSEWNFKVYSQQCYDTFKVRPKEDHIEKMYGGTDLRTYSNIIFSNGDLDPWKSGGVTKLVSPGINVLILQDSAHHLDLRAANKNDPKSVIKARQLYFQIFRKWIRKYRKKKCIRRDTSHWIDLDELFSRILKNVSIKH